MKSIAVLLVTAMVLFSAEKPEIGGYLKNHSSIMIDKGSDELFTDIAEFRVEGSWNWGNGGMEVHVNGAKALRPIIPFFEVYRDSSLMMGMAEEMIKYYMDIIIPSIDSMFGPIPTPDSTIYNDDQKAEMLRLGKQLPYSSMWPATSFNLDRALIKLYTKPMDIFIGRQSIAWGTGYAFNPTDLWNMKSPVDPTAPKIGINAFRAEIPLGDMAGVSLVASTGREFKHSSGGVRVKWNIGNFDMSISGLSIMNADREMFSLKKKLVAGTDLAGQIGDIGVWYEVAVSNPVYSDITNFDSLFSQVDLGVDYTFTNGLYIMAEYLYNSLGDKDSKEYTLYDMAKVAGGEAPGLAKSYLFGGLRRELGGQVSIGLFGLANLNDISGLFLPQINYTFNDHIDIELKGIISAGDKTTTEYGSMKSAVQFVIAGYF